MAAVRFCDLCDAAMGVETGSGAVVFVCHCGASVPGGPEAARLAAVDYKAETMYGDVIRSAAGDRTTAQLASPCPSCGTPHRSLLILGDRRQVVVLCDFCLRTESGAESAATAAKKLSGPGVPPDEAGASPAGEGASQPGAGAGAGAGAGSSGRRPRGEASPRG